MGEFDCSMVGQEPDDLSAARHISSVALAFFRAVHKVMLRLRDLGMTKRTAFRENYGH